MGASSYQKLATPYRSRSAYASSVHGSPLGVQAPAIMTQGYAVAIAENCSWDGAQRRACRP